MTERTGDHEWRIESDEAEAFLYSQDDTALEYPRLRAGIEAATRLPGLTAPVYAAASPHGSGWVVSSNSHVAPGLASAPRAGLLLVADSPLHRLGLPPAELSRLLARRLSETPVPAVGEGALRAACETGAVWAAEEELIEEEDLFVLGSLSVRGEADALGVRALSAGSREWDPRFGGAVNAWAVGETLDSEATEALGLYEGAVVFAASAGSAELGRLALEGHRQRIISREFGDSERLAAAPSGTEEAADLVAASEAAANYALARVSLLVYALRRAMGAVVGEMSLSSCWATGGLQERDGATVHRSSLARIGAGEPLACGDALARGTGAMLGSAPPFSPGGEERWTWEEAGLLERVARFEEPGGRP